MNKNKIYELQTLLLIWLSKYEYRSFEVIKNNCNSLNDCYELHLSKPVWSIFWPLVYNGLVDYAGNGHYAITEPIILNFEKIFFCINFTPSIIYKSTNVVGIYMTDQKPTEKNIKMITVNPLYILKQFPSIEDVVNSFSKSFQEVSNLEYYNKKTKRGIAKIGQEGLTKYFSIPEKSYLRELPNSTINPDAFAITYCLSRKINQESNGRYDLKNKNLYMPSFAIPISIYRVLLLETMCSGNMPELINKEYHYCPIKVG